jgi:hypothetical protein
MRKVSRQPAKCKQQSVTLKRVIRKAASLAALNAPQNVGYLPSMLVLTTLPHRRPKALAVHRRTNGKLTFEIRPDVVYGMPYGAYPRLILLYVCQQVVLTKSPIVELGPGLSTAMRRCGFAVTGGAKGTIAAFRRQLDSLFYVSVGWTYREGRRITEEERCVIFRGRDTWTESEFGEPAGCRVTVDPRFLTALVEHPVPNDLTVLRTLAALHGPFAIDLYTWLPYRLWGVTRSEDISWAALREQFGADFSVEDNFRKAFLEALKAIRPYYPTARVEILRGGIRLWPSPSTIKPTFPDLCG